MDENPDFMTFMLPIAKAAGELNYSNTSTHGGPQKTFSTPVHLGGGGDGG